jgi:hypothetical protein
MRSLLIGFALIVSCAGGAGAVTISASASGGDASMPITDTDGPAGSGTVFAEVVIPTDAFAAMEGRSALDETGNSALALSGVYASTGKPHLAGIPFPQVMDAVTTWSASVTNMSLVPRAYVYRFTLNPFTLRLQDITGLSDSDPTRPLASFDVEVRVNNVLAFEAHALLRGGTSGHVLLESGTDLGGTFSGTEGAVWYDFATFNGSLSAGIVGPNESVTVETKLIAHTECRLVNTGGVVDMGDPLDLKGDPGVAGVFFGEDDAVGVEAATWSAAKRLYR